MTDETGVNPLTAHLMNLVQGRQQTEVAKLSLLSAIAGELTQCREHLVALHKELTEINERARRE